MVNNFKEFHGHEFHDFFSLSTLFCVFPSLLVSRLLVVVFLSLSLALEQSLTANYWWRILRAWNKLLLFFKNKNNNIWLKMHIMSAYKYTLLLFFVVICSLPQAIFSLVYSLEWVELLVLKYHADFILLRSIHLNIFFYLYKNFSLISFNSTFSFSVLYFNNIIFFIIIMFLMVDDEWNWNSQHTAASMRRFKQPFILTDC